MADKDAVAAARQVKRNVLVGLLGAGAAVCVPDLHALAVFHEGAEALAKAVDLLVHGQAQLLAHVGGVLRTAVIGVIAVPGCLDIGQVAAEALREEPAVLVILHAPAFLVDDELCGAAGDGDGAGRLGKGSPARDLGSCLREPELRSLAHCSQMVPSLHPDDVRSRRGDPDRQVDALQGISSPLDSPCRRYDPDRALLLSDLVSLLGRKAGTALLIQPVAVSEFHMIPPFAARPGAVFCADRFSRYSVILLYLY